MARINKKGRQVRFQVQSDAKNEIKRQITALITEANRLMKIYHECDNSIKDKTGEHLVAKHRVGTKRPARLIKKWSKEKGVYCIPHK